MTDRPTVLLVEGESDAAAVRAVAALLEVPLATTEVIAMGGITNLSAHLASRGRTSVLGLYDAAEERFVRRVLSRHGLSVDGFFRCSLDLEDELLRALGVAAAERVLETQGELELFRRFQFQPAQRGRSEHAQLRRFVGTASGRKIRLGGELAAALPRDRVPEPMLALLDRVRLHRP